jgi:ABC-2 type transport system ATP-binding protein
VEHTADHVIVIGRGRLIADCAMAEFIARSSSQAILVRTPEPGALARAVTTAGARVADAGDGDPGELEVSGLAEERIGDIAFAHGIRLHHLAPSRASLEQAFMELTSDSVEYHAGPAASRQPSHVGTEN